MHRRTPLLAVVTGLALAWATPGCGTDPGTTTGAPTDGPPAVGETGDVATTVRSAPLPTYSGPECLRAGQAVERLTTTRDRAHALEQAEVLRGLDPPTEVDGAIDTIVGLVDAAAMSDELAESSRTLFAWLLEVCPG